MTVANFHSRPLPGTVPFVFLLAAVMLSSCMVPPRHAEVGRGQITPDMLIESSPLAKRSELKDVSQVDILAITPQMAAFLDRYVEQDSGENTKYRRLLRLVMEDGEFELVYDDTTRTAAETYRDHRGNCLSFTNLFVAMARYVGLDANYQEVEIPPDWSIAGHSLLLSQHVNAFVNLAQYSDRVVDFNTEVVNFRVLDLKPTYKREIISDHRARAHYFNNIGVEHMLLGGDVPSALANLQQSVREDPTFPPAWISLGILHRREGYPDYAETAYLQALKVDPVNLVAMSNLANLYDDEGRAELAQQYRRLVQSHRMNNPYYRYYLAEEAFTSGDYSTAIEHLTFAVRERRDEDRFYFLLSLSYMMAGDRVEARRWMEKAEEVAAGAADRQKYHHKLEMLRSLDPTEGL